MKASIAIQVLPQVGDKEELIRIVDERAFFIVTDAKNVFGNGFENIADNAIKTAEKGDIVITMGGGDIYKAAHIIQKRLGNIK